MAETRDPRRFLLMFAVGIGLMAVLVSGILFMQRGARIGLTGKFLKVRTAALDENSTVVVVDFRVNNPSDVLFVVHTVSLLMEDNDGKTYDGIVSSEVDAKRLFEGLPLLGQKFNDTLVMRDRIPGRSTTDRMVAVRYEAPEARIQARKRFLLRIKDVDGAVVEIPER
jgi:hypothetical protein